MYTRRSFLLFCWLLSGALAACEGGSGSSGFDIHSENAAIQQALSEQRCVQHESLTICPAAEAGTPTPGTTAPVIPATPTPAPAQPTSTPSGNTSTPGVLPTVTPTGAPTSRPSASRTATATASPGAAQVIIAINSTLPLSCTAAHSGGCGFVIPFAASGFSASAVFRAAVRTVNPSGPWMLGAALVANGLPTSIFDAPVAISGAATTPATGPITAQAAVLVFAGSSATVPTTVTDLVDTGAEAAYVTVQFMLQPQ